MAQNPRFHIEALASHDRTTFSCGNDRIDKYFREIVTQDIKRGLANCFVAVETATGRLAGFYTLTSSGIPLDDIPEELKKKLPRHQLVGVALIGWLGRHVDFAGLGLGDALLFDAIRSIAVSPQASHAIIVDAIDDDAIKFYDKWKFIKINGGTQTRRYIPTATAKQAIKG
jgi:ribosomal protein S18 acetylase RimI-like enzyme